jgi:hypothetical protein
MTAPGGYAPGTAPMGYAPGTAPMTTGTFGADFNAGTASGAANYQSFQMLGGAAAMGAMMTQLNQDTTIAAQNAAQTAAAAELLLKAGLPLPEALGL